MNENQIKMNYLGIEIANKSIALAEAQAQNDLLSQEKAELASQVQILQAEIERLKEPAGAVVTDGEKDR